LFREGKENQRENCREKGHLKVKKKEEKIKEMRTAFVYGFVGRKF
jgi:hypothetical protein